MGEPDWAMYGEGGMREQYVESFAGPEAQRLAGMAFDELSMTSEGITSKELEYMREQIMHCVEEVREQVTGALPGEKVIPEERQGMPGESLMPYGNLEGPVGGSIPKSWGVPMEFFEIIGGNNGKI